MIIAEQNHTAGSTLAGVGGIFLLRFMTEGGTGSNSDEWSLTDLSEFSGIETVNLHNVSTLTVSGEQYEAIDTFIGRANTTIEIIDTEPDFETIQETPDQDTSGHETRYSNIIDNLLSLPGAQAGKLEPGQAQQAYLHIEEGESREYDHDTFAFDLNSETDYRIKITPEDPSVFQGSKIARVYDPSGDWEHSIMNNGFHDGVLYSDVFTAQEEGDHYLSVSLEWYDGTWDGSADGPEPYEIELVEVNNASDASNDQQIETLGISTDHLQNEVGTM